MGRTTAETTSAERISALLDDDGMRFTTRDGHTLADLVVAEGAHTEWRDGYRTGDVVRHTFADGSVITEAAGGWDFGYADCFCWAGAGHTESCTATHPALTECAYCHVDVPESEGVPAVDDEDAWAEIATHHDADCEWVATRAHRQAAGARALTLEQVIEDAGSGETPDSIPLRPATATPITRTMGEWFGRDVERLTCGSPLGESAANGAYNRWPVYLDGARVGTLYEDATGLTYESED